MKTLLSFCAGGLLALLFVVGVVKYLWRGLHHASIYGQNVTTSGVVASAQTFIAVTLFWPLFVMHDMKQWDGKVLWYVNNIVAPLSQSRMVKYAKTQEELNTILNHLDEQYFTGESDE